MYQPWPPLQQQQQQDESFYQYGDNNSYRHTLYDTSQLPDPLNWNSSRSNSPPCVSPRMSQSGGVAMLPPPPLSSMGGGIDTRLQGEDGLVPVADNRFHMTSDTPAVSGRRTRQQYQLQNLVHLPAHTPAATSRAARRHRMARQRSAGDHRVRGRGAASSQRPSARHNPSWSQPADVDGAPLPSSLGRNMANLQFLFKKELKPSDVGSLGRIILPKREAESQLPPLNVKDGIPIHAEDYDTGKPWTLKYRYWPNNKSRMYVLESTGEFVKLNQLEEGDWMILYRCGSSARPKYVLRGRKRSSSVDDMDVCEMSGRVTEESTVGGEGNEDGDAAVAGSSTASTSAMNEEEVGMVSNSEAAGQEPAPALVPGLAADACVMRDACDNEFLQGFLDDSSFVWEKFPPLERFQPLETDDDVSIDDILDALPLLHHHRS